MEFVNQKAYYVRRYKTKLNYLIKPFLIATSITNLDSKFEIDEANVKSP